MVTDRTPANANDQRLERIREKLRAARVAFEDDTQNDHGVLGHVLDILEHEIGLDDASEPPIDPPPAYAPAASAAVDDPPQAP